MSRDRVIAALGIYGTCGILAAAGTAALGRSVWHLDHVLFASRAVALPLAAAVGLAVGGGGAALTRALVRRSRWGRALHVELRRGLLGLAPGAVFPLAAASALGEELFFRGGVQASLASWLGPAAGLALTSLAFGLAHVPSSRRLWAWTGTAAVMGVVFGALYMVTGELAAPIAAHAVINFANTRFLLRHAPESASGGAVRAAAVGTTRPTAPRPHDATHARPRARQRAAARP
jgi:membrane protease YdiL (CAAX protease family)